MGVSVHMHACVHAHVPVDLCGFGFVHAVLTSPFSMNPPLTQDHTYKGSAITFITGRFTEVEMNRLTYCL